MLSWEACPVDRAGLVRGSHRVLALKDERHQEVDSLRQAPRRRGLAVSDRRVSDLEASVDGKTTRAARHAVHRHRPACRQ